MNWTSQTARMLFYNKDYNLLRKSILCSSLLQTTQPPPDIEDNSALPFLFNIKNRDFYHVPSHLGDAPGT